MLPKFLVTKSNKLLKCVSSNKAGEDYESVTGLTLIFNSTVTTLAVSVSIVNDDIVEGNQSFFGNLSNPEGPVTLNLAQATVTIEDDDTIRKCLRRNDEVCTFLQRISNGKHFC